MTKEDSLEKEVSRLMKSKGILTRRELASLIGYSEQMLSMVLKRRQQPTVLGIARFSHALGINAAESCALFDINDEEKIQQAQEAYEKVITVPEIRSQFNRLYSIICKEITYQYHQKPPEERRVMIDYLSRVLGKYNQDVIEHTHLALDLLDILRENRFPAELNLPVRTTTEIGSALDLLQQRIPEDNFGQVLEKTYQGFVAALNTAFQAREPAEKIIFLDQLEKVLMQYSKK